MDTDDVNELTQAISTTIFMNFLVIKKPNFYNIPNPEEVKSIYKHHISSLINANESSQSRSADDLAERIFTDDFDISDLTASDVLSCANWLKKRHCTMLKSLFHKFSMRM